MLYYISRFLEQYDIPGAHLWSYVSFRALLTLILALLISAWFGERFIKWMKRRKIFETERDPSIDPFGVEKKGVPTMGGVIIIVSILVPVLLFGRIRNIYLILMIITTIWLGFLGFLDDYIKIFQNNTINTFPLMNPAYNHRREQIKINSALEKIAAFEPVPLEEFPTRNYFQLNIIFKCFISFDIYIVCISHN